MREAAKQGNAERFSAQRRLSGGQHVKSLSAKTDGQINAGRIFLFPGKILVF